MSYWLSNHVNDAKEELNVSTWENYSTEKKSHKLEEVIEVIENDEMPLKPYTWMHPEAKLTTEQKQKVIAWAKRSRALYQLNQQPR